VTLRRGVALLGGVLVLFHVWLLGRQIWEGQLAEPGLLLRWLIAAGLVAALVHLARRGQPLLWGRRATAVWLLAAVLHGPAIAGELADHTRAGLPEAVTALVEIAAASVLLGLGLGLLAQRQSPWQRPAQLLALAAPRSHRLDRRPWLSLRAVPRPPPSVLSLVAA
jgi:hypothetical protein